jgi:hypothetical protein
VEYLENVLPALLLSELRPLLVDTRLALGKVSTRSDILAELGASRYDPETELAELLAHIDALRKIRKPVQPATGPESPVN